LLRKLTLTVFLLVVLGGATGQAAQATSNYQQALRAVCYYFGANCATAMRIVKCETGGTYSPWSANGQYLGIFQMGSNERATFGHGNNVWAQAKAAKAYFDAEVKSGHNGFDPWLKYEPPGCGY
jgi:hypothetical protein